MQKHGMRFGLQHAATAFVAVVLLSACGAGSSGVVASTTTPATSFAAGATCIVPGASGLPDAATGQDAYRYLLDYTAFATYRTGTDGDRQMSAWVMQQLRGMGYSVATEQYPFSRYVSRQASLTVGTLTPKVFPMYYSGTTGGSAISAPIVDIGTGTAVEAAAAKGAIAFAEVPILLNSQTPTLNSLITTAAAQGARALVIALQGPENEIVALNADSRTGLCGFPVLQVGKVDGAQIKLMSGSPATFLLNATIETAQLSNIVATLPGNSNDIVMIGTPKNPWFTSAAERGTSVGGLLTLARYFATRGPYNPTLIFLATGGHEVGYLGLQAFLDAHPDLVPRIGAYVHLGASLAAKDFVEINGKAQPTGTQNLITLYVSENPLMETLATTSMSSNGVIYDAIAPSVLDPGEQQSAYKAKIPIASISASHFWFHTERDLPDLTSCSMLDPVIKGYRDLIQNLVGQSAANLRAANAAAAALAGNPPAPAACLVAPSP